jgi:hypothetical protein
VVALKAGDAPAGADIVLVLGRDYTGLSHPGSTASPTTATKPKTTGGSTAATVGSSSALPAAGC